MAAVNVLAGLVSGSLNGPLERIQGSFQAVGTKYPPPTLPPVVRQDSSGSPYFCPFSRSLAPGAPAQDRPLTVLPRDPPPGGSAGSPGRSCGGSLRPRSGLVPSYQPCPMVIPKRVHSIPFLTINLTRSLQVCYIAIISQEFSRYAGGAGISAGPADPWRL